MVFSPEDRGSNRVIREAGQPACEKGLFSLVKFNRVEDCAGYDTLGTSLAACGPLIRQARGTDESTTELRFSQD